jgi:hypothetical protein
MGEALDDATEYGNAPRVRSVRADRRTACAVRACTSTLQGRRACVCRRSGDSAGERERRGSIAGFKHKLLMYSLGRVVPRAGGASRPIWSPTQHYDRQGQSVRAMLGPASEDLLIRARPSCADWQNQHKWRRLSLRQKSCKGERMRRLILLVHGLAAALAIVPSAAVADNAAVAGRSRPKS